MAKRFCDQCGELLGPNARFCPGCGVSVTGKTESLFQVLLTKKLLVLCQFSNIIFECADVPGHIRPRGEAVVGDLSFEPYGARKAVVRDIDVGPTRHMT